MAKKYSITTARDLVTGGVAIGVVMSGVNSAVNCRSFGHAAAHAAITVAITTTLFGIIGLVFANNPPTLDVDISDKPESNAA